jgi:Tol biopolymer transport system component
VTDPKAVAGPAGRRALRGSVLTVCVCVLAAGCQFSFQEISLEGEGPGRRPAPPGSPADEIFPADAVPTRCNGQIAFMVSRVGSERFEIHTSTPDGDERQNLTSGLSGSASDPAWSPDGKRLAFTGTIDDARNSDIYVATADFGRVRRLTTDPDVDMNPAWSPDGSQIAFVSSRGSSESDVYVMKADGSQQRPVLLDIDVQGSPTWAPDGTALAFVSNHEGAAEAYAIGTDGLSLTRLTFDEWDDVLVDWAPDGFTLLVESVRNGQGDIFLINPDAGHRQKLTTSFDGSAPAWSPDGESIAFMEGRTEGWGVSVMDTGGAIVSRIPSNASQEGHPDWRPRGVPGCSGTPGSDTVA